MPKDDIQRLKEQLKNAQDDRERLDCLIALGDELRISAPSEAKPLLEEALKISRDIGAMEQVARVSLRLAEVCRLLGDVEMSRHYASETLKWAKELGHERLQGSGFYLLGTLYEKSGQYEEALQCTQQALKIWEKNGYEEGVYAALNQMGNLAGFQGRFEEALRYYRRCGELLKDSSDESLRAANYYNIGWVLIELGNWEEGAENLYRTIALAERRGYDYVRWNAVNVLGELALKKNRLDRAVELFSQVVKAGREGLEEILQEGLINLGEAEFRQHNLAAASAAYQEALTLCERTQDRLGITEIYWRMAELELARGEMERCAGLCARAIEMARELQANKEEAEALRVRALLEIEMGMEAAAIACFEKALELLRGAQNSYEYARVQFQYGRFLLKQGQQEQGVALLKKAAQVFRNLGVVAEADEINRILFELDLNVDRDMAVLSAVSGLSTMGLEPANFLAETFKRMCEAWGCRGGSFLSDNEPVFVFGQVDLDDVRRAAANGRKQVSEGSIVWFPVVAGDSFFGGIYLEYESKAVRRCNPLVLNTIAALIMPAVQRLKSSGISVEREEEEIPGLCFSGVIGHSPVMQKNLEIVARSAYSSVPVLIRGESGTGKELVARALHLSGPRRDKPFIPINCAAVPETLLEAEFFGVEKGAATGVVARKGKFELANGGTVFLDEIGDMSPGLQAKLLRVLQEKEFERIGGAKPIKVDVRVVAATNQNLELLIKEGKFREDLYYRLNGVEIFLPPLRERKEDIGELIRYFIARANQETNRQVKGVTEGVLRCFLAYHWPGNIRELQHVIQRCVLLAQGDEITVSDLPVQFQKLIEEIPQAETVNLRISRRRAQEQAAAEVERETLVRCLEQAGGNVTRAAKIAGYSRAQFYRLLKKHNISPQK